MNGPHYKSINEIVMPDGKVVSTKVYAKGLSPLKPDIEELKEKLASIEHERWPNGKKKYVRTDAQRKHNNEWTKTRWARATEEERERRRIRNRSYYRLVREETLSAYGGECKCCGISQDAFLSLDHVNNDGNSHR